MQTARVQIAEIDQSYSNTVGKYMCTDFCACVKPDFKMWPSAQHIEFKKTKAQGGVYNFNGTYENFFDCYDDKKILFAQLQNQAATTGPTNAATIPTTDPNWISTEDLSIARFMETVLNCSGFCVEPTFWMFNSVKTGPPPVACIGKLKEQYDLTVGPIGIITALTLVFVLLAFIGHFWLYRQGDIAPK